eukprot:GHVU01190465.1.p1 GENE.GHVU01190465.1~~GHVU01190465.1.p1  ORF type:complete len:178 (+),score=41.65 GHVU01190465.1:52-534(+)
MTANGIDIPMPEDMLLCKLEGMTAHFMFESKSPIHKSGMVAKRDIKKGELLVDFKGTFVDAATAAKLAKDNRSLTMLFQISDNLYIDAFQTPTIGRLINHSCNPNCVALRMPLEKGGPLRYVGVFARRDIPAKEEITFDYMIQQPMEKCNCKAAECRGEF